MWSRGSMKYILVGRNQTDLNTLKGGWSYLESVTFLDILFTLQFIRHFSYVLCQKVMKK